MKQKEDVNQPREHLNFMRSYQVNRAVELIQTSIQKIISQWLSDNHHGSERKASLPHILENDLSVSINEFPLYIQQIWAKPYEIIPELKPLPLENIKKLIETTVSRELTMYLPDFNPSLKS